MLLFAICVDPLLGLICLILDIEKDELVAAFADDIGVVIADIEKCLPKLVTLFETFGAFSGLKLNLSKCNVVPLTDSGLKIAKFRQLFLPLHRNGAPSKSLALRSISVFFLDPMLTTLSGMVLFARLPTLSEDGSSSIPVSFLTFLLVMFTFFPFSHTLVSLFTLTTRLLNL